MFTRGLSVPFLPDAMKRGAPERGFLPANGPVGIAGCWWQHTVYGVRIEIS